MRLMNAQSVKCVVCAGSSSEWVRCRFLVMRLQNSLTVMASVLPTANARNLGFIFNSNLTFPQQISAVLRRPGGELTKGRNVQSPAVRVYTRGALRAVRCFVTSHKPSILTLETKCNSDDN